MAVTYKRQFNRRRREYPPEVTCMFYREQTAEDFRRDYLDAHPLESAPASPVAGIPVSRDVSYVRYVKAHYPRSQWRQMLFGSDEPAAAKPPVLPSSEPTSSKTPPDDSLAERLIGEELSRALEQKYGSGVRSLAQQKHPQQSQPSPKIPSVPTQEESPLETKCLYCGKPISSTPGHKRRLYCSNNCRVKACQQRNR